MSPTTTTGYGEDARSATSSAACRLRHSSLSGVLPKASRCVLTNRKVRPRCVRSIVDHPRSTRIGSPNRLTEKDESAEKFNDRALDTELCFSASVRTRIRSWSVKRPASVGEIGIGMGIAALVKFVFLATTVYGSPAAASAWSRIFSKSYVVV
jgi:hypothetical protein